MKRRVTSAIALLCLVATACSDELGEVVEENDEKTFQEENVSSITDSEKETFLASFAKDLSVAVYERQDVRSFLLLII